MLLLQVIIQVAVGTMTHGFPQLRFDGLGVGVVTITGDSLRDTTGDGARGPEEFFCCRAVTRLTQQDVYQIPIAIAA